MMFSFFRQPQRKERGLGFHPSTRFFTAAALFATCLILDPIHLLGAIGIICTVVAAWILYRPEAGQWVSIGLFGLAMFAPVFLFLPWVAVPQGSPELFSPEGFLLRLAIPWRIFARGEAVLLITGGAMTSMSSSSFQAGLSRLPLPRFLQALAAQIVHNTGMLATETRRIGQAMAIRGGTSGLRTSMMVARSLPSTWLPRVVERADRVASAMELRCFDGIPIDFDQRRFQVRDGVAILVTFLWVAGAGVMRFGGIV